MANLGYEVIGASSDTAGAGRQKKTNLPVMPEAGTIDSITFYCDNLNSTTRQIRFGLIRESDGVVIAQSAISTIAVASGAPEWVTLLCAGETLVDAEGYSIVRLQEDGSPKRWYDAGQTGYYEGDLAGTWDTVTAMPSVAGVTGRRLSGYITYTAAVAGVSLTAPDTVTHGVATTATGASLSTVNVTTGMTLEYGTVAIAQTATFVDPDLNFTPDVGVPTLYGSGNAVDSLPLTPDSASAGTTAYQVTLEITDG